MGYRMIFYSVVAPLFVFPLLLLAGPINYNDGGYDGVVVSIADNVPAHDCRNVLDKLEVSLFPRNSRIWEEEIVLVRGARVLYLSKSCKYFRTWGEIVTILALRVLGTVASRGMPSDSRPDRFIPRERDLGAHWIGGSVGFGVGLDALERKVSCDCRESVRSLVDI
jgi:hypothetical protein